MKKCILFLLLVMSAMPANSQNCFPKANKKNLWGYVDMKNKWLLKPVYEEASPMSDGYAVCKLNSSYGVIDGNFVEVIPFENKKIDRVSKDIFYVTGNNGASFLRFVKNKKSVSCDPDWKILNNGSFCYSYNGKYGFCDRFGNNVHDTFKSIECMDAESGSPYYACTREDGSFFYVDCNCGKFFDSRDYDTMEVVGEAFYIVSKNGNYSFIDRRGNFIKTDFSAISAEGNVLTLTKDDNKTLYDFVTKRNGFIMPDGPFWLPASAKNLRMEGKFYVWNEGGKTGIVDNARKTFFEGCSDVRKLNDRYYAVSFVSGGGEYWEISNESGVMLTNASFDAVGDMDSYGFVPYRVSDGYNVHVARLLCTNGKVYVVVPGSQSAEGLSGCTDVTTSKSGFCDERGKIVIAPKFDKVTQFGDGLAGYYVKGKGWGFINKSGTVVIPAKFQNIMSLFGQSVEGCAVVFDGTGSYFIDKKGRPVYVY